MRTRIKTIIAVFLTTTALPAITWATNTVPCNTNQDPDSITYSKIIETLKSTELPPNIELNNYDDADQDANTGNDSKGTPPSGELVASTGSDVGMETVTAAFPTVPNPTALTNLSDQEHFEARLGLMLADIKEVEYAACDNRGSPLFFWRANAALNKQSVEQNLTALRDLFQGAQNFTQDFALTTQPASFEIHNLMLETGYAVYKILVNCHTEWVNSADESLKRLQAAQQKLAPKDRLLIDQKRHDLAILYNFYKEHGDFLEDALKKIHLPLQNLKSENNFYQDIMNASRLSQKISALLKAYTQMKRDIQNQDPLYAKGKAAMPAFIEYYRESQGGKGMDFRGGQGYNEELFAKHLSILREKPKDINFETAEEILYHLKAIVPFAAQKAMAYMTPESNINLITQKYLQGKTLSDLSNATHAFRGNQKILAQTLQHHKANAPAFYTILEDLKMLYPELSYVQSFSQEWPAYVSLPRRLENGEELIKLTTQTGEKEDCNAQLKKLQAFLESNESAPTGNTITRMIEKAMVYQETAFEPALKKIAGLNKKERLKLIAEFTGVKTPENERDEEEQKKFIERSSFINALITKADQQYPSFFQQLTNRLTKGTERPAMSTVLRNRSSIESVHKSLEALENRSSLLIEPTNRKEEIK